MAKTEETPRHQDFSSSNTRKEGLTTIRSTGQAGLTDMRKKALRPPQDFPNSPRLVRWWDARSWNWLPGLEVVMLLIAILMISIALPLQAGLISLGGDEKRNHAPVEETGPDS